MIRIDIDRWEEILVTLTRNKARSLLTAFGVFWGIFMLVALMGGSKGLKNLMAANFEGFATNSGFLFPDQTDLPYKGFQKGRSWQLEVNDIERVRQSVRGIDVITGTTVYWGKQAYYSKFTMNVSVKGVYPEYALIENPDLKYGRYINEMDLKDRRKVCVIGKRVWEQLFPEGGDPCGQFIRVDGTYYQVIGVSLTAGNIGVNSYPPECVSIPYSTMRDAYNLGRQVQMLCFTVRPGYSVSTVEPQVSAVLKRAHRIHPDDQQALISINTEALFAMIDNLFRGIQLLSWLVGIGTLLAGIIGVSNIMMVTVKERTTEIGIRRAIGARPRDILHQILSESMVLTLLAGMAGICFGVLVLQGLESTAGASFQIDFWTAVGTCLLLGMLGMLAGLAPAYRALAIKPIDAIRDE
jgi:putative ABC transport system permease protein